MKEYMSWEEFVEYRTRYAGAIQGMIDALKEYEEAKDIFWLLRDTERPLTWSAEKAGVTTKDLSELDEKLNLQELFKELRELEAKGR